MCSVIVLSSEAAYSWDWYLVQDQVTHMPNCSLDLELPWLVACSFILLSLISKLFSQSWKVLFLIWFHDCQIRAHTLVHVLLPLFVFIYQKVSHMISASWVLTGPVVDTSWPQASSHRKRLVCRVIKWWWCHWSQLPSSISLKFSSGLQVFTARVLISHESAFCVWPMTDCAMSSQVNGNSWMIALDA
jgi:hypothetical protein